MLALSSFRRLLYSDTGSKSSDQLLFKNISFTYILERRKRERETLTGGLSHTHTPPSRGLAHNPEMCPDWESNQQPSSLKASAQLTEPHQPEL